MKDLNVSFSSHFVPFLKIIKLFAHIQVKKNHEKRQSCKIRYREITNWTVKIGGTFRNSSSLFITVTVTFHYF